jgi:hypothetical protein
MNIIRISSEATQTSTSLPYPATLKYKCRLIVTTIDQLVTSTVIDTSTNLSLSLSHQPVTDDQPIIQPVIVTITISVTDIPSSTNCNQIHSHGYQNHHQTMYINHQSCTSINHVHQLVPYHASTMYINLVPYHASTMYQNLYHNMCINNHAPYHVSEHQPCTSTCTIPYVKYPRCANVSTICLKYAP